MPKVLDEAGFSSKVATYRLLDAIRAVQGTSRTTMHQTAVGTPADLSGVVIPKAGISVDSVAASLRSILPGGWRHEISGEFTAAGSRLDLLLRLNGRKLFSASDAGPDAADRLIALGALIVVANIQPYVAASYLYETNKIAAFAAAAQIIAALPPNDENVARAYNLEGLIAQDQGRMDEAIRIYQGVIHDYSTFAIPHNNLGFIWESQHKIENAIAEYRAAMRLDPKFASRTTSSGLFCVSWRIPAGRPTGHGGCWMLAPPSLPEPSWRPTIRTTNGKCGWQTPCLRVRGIVRRSDAQRRLQNVVIARRLERVQDDRNRIRIIVVAGLDPTIKRDTRDRAGCGT
ncbi:MAG: tetratricopeptide repeat protein [Alphaproteobacteria bacterium]|nr:tetratricopeptide repeat protein [Alphaproteobacteria bacterium]